MSTKQGEIIKLKREIKVLQDELNLAEVAFYNKPYNYKREFWFLVPLVGALALGGATSTCVHMLG